jgi:hypothetical protein
MRGDLSIKIEMELDRYQKMLTELKSLSPVKAIEETFLEISGYPYLENVASNILEFFFDSEEAHGLGSVFLEALLSTAQNSDIGFSFENTIVEREVVTPLQCRIDLVITTSSLIVGIENKLFSNVNNDLPHYCKFLKDKALELQKETLDNVDIVPVLLTLYPVSKSQMMGDFTNITYKQFFKTLMPKLGSSILNANARYTPLLLDFIQTINHLQEGPKMENDPFHHWIKTNQKDAESLMQKVKEYRRKLKNRIKTLNSFVDLQKYVENKINIRQWFWDPPSGEILRALVYDLKIHNEINLAIDIYLDPREWSILLFCRDSSDPIKYQNFLNWVNKHHIPYSEIENSSRLLIGERMDSSTLEMKVAEQINTLLQLILDGILSDEKTTNSFYPQYPSSKDSVDR